MYHILGCTYYLFSFIFFRPAAYSLSVSVLSHIHTQTYTKVIFFSFLLLSLSVFTFNFIFFFFLPQVTLKNSLLYALLLLLQYFVSSWFPVLFFFFSPYYFWMDAVFVLDWLKKKLLSYSFPPNTRVYVVPVYVCGFLFLLFLNQILFYTLSIFIPFPKTFSYHLSTRSVTSQWLFPFCVCVYTQNVVLRAAERLIVCWRCAPCVYFGHNVTWVFVFSIIMIILFTTYSNVRYKNWMCADFKKPWAHHYSLVKEYSEISHSRHGWNTNKYEQLFSSSLGKLNESVSKKNGCNAATFKCLSDLRVVCSWQMWLNMNKTRGEIRSFIV